MEPVIFGAVAYFEDGTPYTYLVGVTDGSINVGWLAAAVPYPTSFSVPARVVSSLLRLARDEPVNRTRGWHECDLCERPGCPVVMIVDGQGIALGDAEIRVCGATGSVYAVPTLVAHYVAEHGYLPPKDFLDGLAHSREVPL